MLTPWKCLAAETRVALFCLVLRCVVLGATQHDDWEPRSSEVVWEMFRKM